jgi:anthranilate phosphoribosyltransferase
VRADCGARVEGRLSAAMESVLRGEPGPRGDAVAASGGAALYVAGLAPDLAGGVEAARGILRRGGGWQVLQRLVAASQGS